MQGIKKIFIIGGLSEAGKSTVGRYLDSKGIIRLKIVNFLRIIMEREDPDADFREWQSNMIENHSKWLWGQFICELKKKIEEESIEYCVLESLYRPSLAEALRRVFGGRLVIVYVDIPQKIRLKRQIIRQNLRSIEEAKEYLLPRDKDKISWGALDIKKMADYVIDNSGTIDQLYKRLDSLVEEECPELIHR